MYCCLSERSVFLRSTFSVAGSVCCFEKARYVPFSVCISRYKGFESNNHSWKRKEHSLLCHHSNSSGDSSNIQVFPLSVYCLLKKTGDLNLCERHHHFGADWFHRATFPVVLLPTLFWDYLGAEGGGKPLQNSRTDTYSYSRSIESLSGLKTSHRNCWVTEVTEEVVGRMCSQRPSRAVFPLAL